MHCSHGCAPATNGAEGTDAAAWAARADELARWAWERYVVRTDVWGGYNPLADRDKIVRRRGGTRGPLGPTCTQPPRRLRGKVRLTHEVLVQHFRGLRPEHVVGAHTTSLDNVSMFGTVEIDHHGPGADPPEVNRDAALGWHAQLRRLGFRTPLLWDSNGCGGYHLDLLFSSPVATPRLYAFLERLVANHADYGLARPPETFPKQRQLVPKPDGRGRCGNWCRLPGRHHTRQCWSTVFDGDRWLSGHDAVDYILSLTGDDPGLLPPLCAPPAPTTSTTSAPISSPSPRGGARGGGRYVSTVKTYRTHKLDNKLVRAVNRCLPGGPGQRNACIMRLVLRLRSCGELTPEEADGAFRLWWSRAEAVVTTKDVAVSLDDYRRAWAWRPEVALRLDWAAVLAEAEAEALPAAFTGWSYPARRLAKAMAVLHRHCGGMFFLSCQCAEDRLGVAHSTAYKTINVMLADDPPLLPLLERITEGSQETGRAAVYRVLWLPPTSPA